MLEQPIRHLVEHEADVLEADVLPAVAARKGDRAVFAPDTRLCTAPRWPRAAAELAVV